jgi:hypothetical protein
MQMLCQLRRPPAHACVSLQAAAAHACGCCDTAVTPPAICTAAAACAVARLMLRAQAGGDGRGSCRRLRAARRETRWHELGTVQVRSVAHWPAALPRRIRHSAAQLSAGGCITYTRRVLRVCGWYQHAWEHMWPLRRATAPHAIAGAGVRGAGMAHACTRSGCGHVWVRRHAKRRPAPHAHEAQAVCGGQPGALVASLRCLAYLKGLTIGALAACGSEAGQLYPHWLHGAYQRIHCH